MTRSVSVSFVGKESGIFIDFVNNWRPSSNVMYNFMPICKLYFINNVWLKISDLVNDMKMDVLSFCDYCACASIHYCH